MQNYNDIIKSNNLIKVETNKSQKEKGKENVEDKKETTSIFSYGKAKLISFKEKNKAKIFDQNLQFEVAEKNYEGTNQLFSILQKLIINIIKLIPAIIISPMLFIFNFFLVLLLFSLLSSLFIKKDNE